MGISRDSWHKRKKTGGRGTQLRGKRKFELGRPPANTRIGERRVHTVRTRGGNTKARALRLECGNFSWGSEVCTRKTRIMEVVYNASNNELVRTNTLVKGAIVSIDAAPFRQWYASHYGKLISNKATDLKPGSKTHQEKVARRNKHHHKLDPALEEQLKSGRLLASIASRPGQSGRADGYLLEGAELAFIRKRLEKKH